MHIPVVTQYQPSMTEWFAAVGKGEDSAAFREEDNRKVDRLEMLYQRIGLSYERPEAFEATDLFTPSPAFSAILAERGEELCAIRLVPKRADLPKLRQRGVSIRRCYEEWVLKQAIQPEEYQAYLCPHSETLLWSATFVVNEEAIFGEVIAGLHMQLTHGFTETPVYRFLFDGKTWDWHDTPEEAQLYVQRMLALVRVQDPQMRARLNAELQATFFQEYLQGYFEATVWPNTRVNIIDYNRILPRYITTPTRPGAISDTEFLVRGSSAFKGVARGKVRIIDPDHLEHETFQEGDILVCDNTDVRCLPLMQRAGAIVTNRGGILSHASIVARELRKPCLIGTGRATEILQEGQFVEVDGDVGVVRAA